MLVFVEENEDGGVPATVTPSDTPFTYIFTDPDAVA